MRLARALPPIILLAVAAAAHGSPSSGEPACDAPALEALLGTRGGWIVTWRDRIAPNRYATTQARATIESTARGCGLLERFEGSREGRPFAAVTLVGPAGNDSLQRVWQDSEHGALLLFQASARSRPLRFEWSRDLGERVLRLRFTYRAVAAGSFTTETELSPDGGRTWQLVSRAEYRRRGPATPPSPR
jgi:hypothetical protein